MKYNSKLDISQYFSNDNFKIRSSKNTSNCKYISETTTTARQIQSLATLVSQGLSLGFSVQHPVAICRNVFVCTHSVLRRIYLQNTANLGMAGRENRPLLEVRYNTFLCLNL